MAYQRVNWADGESGGTPMIADNLNRMDAGIFQNSEDIEELKEKATNVEVNPILTTGTKIAEITVDEETKGIYAPPGGGGGTDFVILTQEEYDALPDSKYTDGIEYRIKASPMNAYNMSYKDTSVGDELDTQKQNIADLSTYSTEEVAIGKWINNKTIYRRVYQATLPICGTQGKSNSTYIDVGANVDMVVDLKIIVIGGTFTAIAPFFSGDTPQNFVRSFYRSDTNTIAIMNASTSYNGLNAVCIMEYTKA